MNGLRHTDGNEKNSEQNKIAGELGCIDPFVLLLGRRGSNISGFATFTLLA